MNTTEWLMFAQTVIMGCTGMFVVYYTYETHRMRQEMANQNRVLHRQLRATQSVSDAVFDWIDSNYEAFTRVFRFRNLGARVTQLVVEAEPAYQVVLQPPATLSAGGTASITFGIASDKLVPLPETLKFTVHYITELGDRVSKRFAVAGQFHFPVEQQPLRNGA